MEKTLKKIISVLNQIHDNDLALLKMVIELRAKVEKLERVKDVI